MGTSGPRVNSMSDISIHIPFPFDDDGYIERKCPACERTFKLQLDEREVEQISEARLNSFHLLNSNRLYKLEEDADHESTCPYCGYSAPVTHWWTYEQRSYIQVYASMVIKEILLRDLAAGRIEGAGHSRGTYRTRLNLTGLQNIPLPVP